jgi:Skp family chaperone for outer membrane proteins
MKFRCILFFWCFPAILFGQNTGYFYPEPVTKHLPEFDCLQYELNTKAEYFMEMLTQKSTVFEQLYYKYMHSGCVTPDQLRIGEEELAAMQQEMINYQERAELSLQLLERSRDSLLHIELNEIVVEFCKANQVDALVEENKILFCTACIDYTSQLVAYIEQRKKRTVDNER